MAHAIGVRATSFVASAFVVGLTMLGALTMTFVQQGAGDFISDVFETFMEPTPPVDPPKIREAAPPPTVTNEGEIQVAPLDENLPLIPTTIAASGGGGEGSGPPNIVDPRWVRVPRDLARYYPSRALERGVQGSVTLNCVVSTAGRLDCVVVSETPARWGFGDAALRISEDYQMVPATRDGVVVEGRHRMVIPFRLQ
jgi:TonB family protein